MNIKIIGSTNVGYILPKDEALKFAGKSAGICYLPHNTEKLFSESEEKTIKRAENTLKSGHHSVYSHSVYNFVLEGIPKILAMILNNEKMYNTSEKSARYTKMESTGIEKELYEEWIEIYKEKIKEKYKDFDEKKVLKLAQENARGIISVFTPATTMEYTTDFRQINYIIHWAEDFIENAENTLFNQKLKEVLKDFINQMPDIIIPELNSKTKNRTFSLFAKRDRKEEFGENYSTNYEVSFSELAQAQRHRTIYYEMQIKDKASYYVPKIIQNTELETKWIKDLSSLENNFPQAMLVKVNERGTVENFILKCQERICGAAQLEIMNQTKDTLDKYIEKTRNTNKDVYEYLLPYSKGARCTFPGFKCTAPCVFGGINALNRSI
ncbi:MAG: FAD-dependent thymidylate synthase [Clostridia bacterium]